MYCKLPLILITLGCLTTIQNAKRPFQLIWTTYNCTKFGERVTYLKCNLTKLAKGYAPELWIEFQSQLSEDLDTEMIITYRLPKSPRIVKFLNHRHNLCNAIKHMQTLPFYNEGFVRIMRYTSLPCNCPIKGKTRYNITNFVFTEDLLPPFTPPLSFNYSFALYENDIKTSCISASGDIIRKK
ncbi:uncharacterized protein LOC131994932 [Stomoxys calcitrans]|uniref:uncharacterized protein LOC131994932 n=1 Tax=Stomoxys calcitrans TaxID=35570 RepID=UPI0027E3120A|nr:uncharacterized protein LOC131994932 [Stomoxys calcitrans]